MRNSTILGGALIAAVAAVGVATPAHAQLKTSFKAAPEFSEGDFKFKVRGRVHYDVYAFEIDRDQGTGVTAAQAAALDSEGTRTSLRRARLGVEGQFSKQWKYKAEVSLLPGNAVEWEDLFVEYVGKNYSVIVGNNKASAPLEEATSSRYITFLERSMITNATGYGRLGGLAFVTGGHNWSFIAAVQGDSVNTAESAGAAGESREQLSTNIRGSWAPIMSATPEGNTVLHIGGSIRYRNEGTSAGALGNVRARPAAFGNGTRFVEAGANRTDMTYGVEGLFIKGPFSVQGEYFLIEGQQRWNPRAGVTSQETTNSGFYIDGIFNITGESRAYKGGEGVINRLVPRAPMSQGGFGALQVAARYEQVDLSEGSDSDRGEQTGFTVGLHWFPEQYVGFKLNYGYTDFDIVAANSSARADGDAQIVSLRTQFDF